MNKTQIISTLHKIANTLDNATLYNEANKITDVMIKLSQNDDQTDEFEKILNFVEEFDLNKEALQQSIDRIRACAKNVARGLKASPEKYTPEILDKKIQEWMDAWLIKFKKDGIGGMYKSTPSRPGTKEEIEILENENNRLKKIIFDKFEELSSSPTQFFQTSIPQEKINATLQEYQNKLEQNPKDFVALRMIELCQNLLNPNYFKSEGALEIAEEKYNRKNPYWDPRD